MPSNIVWTADGPVPDASVTSDTMTLGRRAKADATASSSVVVGQLIDPPAFK